MVATTANGSAGADRRGSERRDTDLAATAVVAGQDLGCSVLDISAGGARLGLVRADPLPAQLTLRLAGFGDLPAEVRWQKGGTVGIRFLGDPATVSELVLAVATYGL